MFGLGLDSLKEARIPQEIRDLAEEREAARKKRDWKLSDELRKRIAEKGFKVEDTPEGYEIIAK